MAPVPRCDLRLPNLSSSVSSKLEGTPRPSTSLTAVKSASGVKSSETKMKRVVTESRLAENVDSQNENEEYGSVPKSADAKVTRDSAEVLEDASEFRTSVTRDSAEVSQHKEAEGENEINACELLKQCKAEVERATANGECEQMKCPNLESIGTPGDVCAQFCHDRRDSPKSVSEYAPSSLSSPKRKYCEKWGRKGPAIECDIKIGDRQRKKESVICKGTYKTAEVYTSLWGSGKAIDFRKKLEAQMKKKRKLLEKMHHKDFSQRQKMRIRAKEKRRALKQKDQSKIPQGDDNLRINKAYDLRLNYNRQLPLMPVTMQHHFDKFRKPPFKRYVTAKQVCTKRVDEFEKLRLPDKK